jgi:LysR family transcriptional regulator, regulator of gene expression of beta-lactamase
MFERELSLGRLVQPFVTKVTIGSYWLTSLKSKAETDAMQAFRSWIAAAAQAQKELR